jgi:MFS family permease
VSSSQSRLLWVTYAELTALYFVQGAAMGMWFVPLTSVLEAHGLAWLRPYAFATSAAAAFVSPLFFGAMADRHLPPVVVLRRLAVATATAMALASMAIAVEASPWVVLAAIQVHAFCSAPAWSLAATVVFSVLRDARNEFGSVRAVATVGWMAGCFLVSAVGADTSALSGFSGAIAWLLVAGLSFLLPKVPPSASSGTVTWRERFGLDALTLLRDRNHRVVFVTTALFSIPLAAFYPYTPPHLRALGFEHSASWMALGQVTEVIAMIALARLLTHWRLKWILGVGLLLGGLRYALCALDTRSGLIAGIFMHGASYTLVSITAQIYLDQRVDPAWRARAQALMSLLVSGVANLVGYLGTGAWFAVQTGTQGVAWTPFWLGLAAAGTAVAVFFLASYRGRAATQIL